MIHLLGALRKKAARRNDARLLAEASGLHAVGLPDGGGVLADASDCGCDPYNSGMFNRADSWARVNKRS